MQVPPLDTADGRRFVRDTGMVVLVLASLGALAAQASGTIPPERGGAAFWQVDLLVVAVFWAEYLWRLWEAPERHGSRWEFVKANWYELPGMLPILPGMEAFGSAKVLRLLRVLRILRLMGALRRFDRFDRAVQRFSRESKLGFVAVFAGSLVVVVATAAWMLEPDTFRDDWWNAVWWGVVTVTTVGYGDFYPVTPGGRLVALVLMIVGVALIGTFAATLSSFLVERRFQAEAAGAVPAAPAADAPVPGFAIAAELERLARLREQGHLDAAEYAAAKRKLLG